MVVVSKNILFISLGENVMRNVMKNVLIQMKNCSQPVWLTNFISYLRKWAVKEVYATSIIFKNYAQEMTKNEDNCHFKKQINHRL